MEAQVKKIHVQEEINRTLGGWHTEVSLQQLGWTPYLVLQYIQFYQSAYHTPDPYTNRSS